MITCKFIALITTCSLITASCNPMLNLPKAANSLDKKSNARRLDILDKLINQDDNAATGPERISFEEVCDGRELIPLGACSNFYVRCSYSSIGHCVSALLEECAIGEVFNGTFCEIPQQNCTKIWSQRMGKINSETERLLEEMNFCYVGGPGIYMFPRIICSRQAYICKNHYEGLAITCLPGMIILRRPFGCFVHPRSCAPDKISLKQSAPLRQHAIERYCHRKHRTKRSSALMVQPKMQCNTWYVGCGNLIEDIIYCANGFIHDTNLQKCRKRNINDRCIMPDLCKNRKWRTISLGDCNRQFIYCRDQIPEEFVCSDGFIFEGQCIPVHQASSQCWKCRNGEQRHTTLHSCNQYSVCENGRWKDYSCPSGMVYDEADQMCRSDPSCAHRSKCEIGTSFPLKCNEYLICSPTGVVQHHFCPPFHRWDSHLLSCIPYPHCSPLPIYIEPCRDGTVIDSFDCKYYHQCSDGKWYRLSCVTYPAELCRNCRHHSGGNSSGHVVAWQKEAKCNEGDTVANPGNCKNYATCDRGKWRNARCKRGTFWNQNLKRCDQTTDCKAFKRAECNHGQYLVGNVCKEYLKCSHGSWITMKCHPGFAFDVTLKKCVASNKCESWSGTYVKLVNYGTDELPISIMPETETKVDGNDKLRKSCKYGKAIRNEYDCNRYFECTMNEYRDRNCEDNYEFNDESGKCEKGYRCDLSRCPEGRMIESGSHGHYQICLNGTWHKRVCDGNRQLTDGFCPPTLCNNDDNAVSKLSSSCEEGSVLGDDVYCNRYFICRKGRLQEQFCWSGANFDKQLGYCVRDSSCMLEKGCSGSNCVPKGGCYDCMSEGSHSGNNCISAGPGNRCKSKGSCPGNNCVQEGSCSGNKIRRDEQYRTAYWTCNDGKFGRRFCPYGFIYNHSNIGCERDTAVHDAKHQTCQENGDSSGYRADPNDCHRFYHCVDGQWVLRVCPNKLYWNTEKVTCDWLPHNDLCKNPIIYV